MKAHGFGSEALNEALILPLRLDNETAYLGLWARLGEQFHSQWERGPHHADLCLSQEPRGQWVLERFKETAFYKALAAPNYKKIIQKRGVSITVADQMAQAIERKLQEGPQHLDALKTEAALFEVESVDDRRTETGHDSLFDIVLDALFRSRRLVRVPVENSWEFHVWAVSLSAENKSYDEAVTFVAERYCDAFPFGQLEDFCWWAQVQKSKVKENFIKAKTAWRNSNEQMDAEEDTFYGLFFTPYRDALVEGNRFHEKAWGLNVDPHPRAPGGLPLVILDGLVIGFWNTENGLVNIDEQLENACLDEESTLFRFKEDMADTVVFRFADLLPVYDIYR